MSAETGVAIVMLIDGLRVATVAPASARPPEHTAPVSGLAGYTAGCRCSDCRAGAAAAKRHFRAAAARVAS